MYRWFQQRAVQWQVVLILGEFALLAGCTYAAVYVRHWDGVNLHHALMEDLAWRPFLVAGILTFSMGALGLYQVHLPTNWLGRLNRQAVAFVLGWISLTVLFYVLPTTYIGRGTLAITMMLGYLVAVIWRLVFRGFVDSELFKRRVVLLGAGERAAEVVRKMVSKIDVRGFRILGYIPVGDDPIAVPAESVLKPGSSLYQWATGLDVDEIVVGPDDRRGTLHIEALLECRQRGIVVTELAAFFEREAGTIKMDLTNPSWLVFSDGFNSSPFRRAVKRIFDMTMATLLLLLAWPFMLLTALAIRLESGPGAPILYRQERVGENGKTFWLTKFRSMRTDAERDGVARWASTHDDRVTRVGRIIRKARLDELPQLCNVLRGDMSIIGPRPERPQFVNDLNTQIRYYSLRHCIRPGLTGWAQLRYPYGSSFDDAEEKLKFDLFYVKNHNLVFDMTILIQTVEVVLFGRGAR